jgi:hypothetical protein
MIDAFCSGFSIGELHKIFLSLLSQIKVNESKKLDIYQMGRAKLLLELPNPRNRGESK